MALTLQTGNLLSVTKQGDLAIIKINPATATEGSTILFESGQIKWGLPVGIDGREIELNATETTIQWRYSGDVAWNNLINLSALAIGPEGLSAYEVAVSEGFIGTVGEWLDSLSPSLTAPNGGTEATPAFTVLGDEDTGIHFPAANYIAVSAGGTTRVTVNTSGVTSTLPVTAPSFVGALDYDDLTNVPTEFLAMQHSHDAGEIVTGTLPVVRGGTGLSTLTAGSFLTGDGINSAVMRTPTQVLTDIGAAAASHTHDDRYYTESETDGLLSGKANTSHTHTIANVTNLQTTINTLLVTVNHGSNASTARPVGVDTVYWKGSVQPTNSLDGDIWYDTSGA